MFMFINGNMNEKVAPTAQAIDAGNARIARLEGTSAQTVKELAELNGTAKGLTHRADGVEKRLDRMDAHIRNEFERVHDKLDRVLESQSRRR